MLSLDDPKWSEFKANYTNGGSVANLLTRAQAGEPLDEWYDDLFQELCHQYTVSESAFPAVPHLVRLSRVQYDFRSHLLILLGACYAYLDRATVSLIPEEMEEEWRSSAKEAVPLIATLLAQQQRDEPELRYLLSSLAAVKGYPDLAEKIEALDVEAE